MVGGYGKPHRLQPVVLIIDPTTSSKNIHVRELVVRLLPRNRWPFQSDDILRCILRDSEHVPARACTPGFFSWIEDFIQTSRLQAETTTSGGFCPKNSECDHTPHPWAPAQDHWCGELLRKCRVALQGETSWRVMRWGNTPPPSVVGVGCEGQDCLPLTLTLEWPFRG
jgi:hypothetical protein